MRHEAAGVVQELAPGLRGMLAPNPGPMTHWGTNTFLIGDRELAIIDPGPDNPQHLAALLSAVDGAEVSHIIVTHAHLDHSPLAPRLAQLTGAPVLAFGDATAGQRPVMKMLVAEGLAGGGEGVDMHFSPDKEVSNGHRIDGNGWHLDVLHTPGHFAGHIALRWDDIVLTGDHVMDWSSSLVSPPDGNLSDFMATSRKLRLLEDTIFYPAHGGPISDPADRLDWLIKHREARETAILTALTNKPQNVPTLTRTVYTDLPEAMLPAAERNVFAHLIDLTERGMVSADPQLGLHAGYRLAR